MSAPEPDNARQELERAATEILSNLTHAGLMPSEWTYERVHRLVAHAYGKGYAAGGRWVMEAYEKRLALVAQALDAPQ